MKKILKIIFIVIGCLLGLILLAFVGANIYRRARYSEFYSISTDVAPNEGLGEDYLPEDLTAYVYNDETIYFTCGNVDGRASRIYVIQDNEVQNYYEIVDENGNVLEEEFNGLTTFGNYLIVSGNYKLHLINLSNFINNPEITSPNNSLINFTNKRVQIYRTIGIESKGDFLFNYNYNTSQMSDDLLFIGEYDSEDENYVYVYRASDVINSGDFDYVRRYLVPTGINGMAIDSEYIVLVSSEGAFAPSNYYLYSRPSVESDNITYILDEDCLIASYEGPSLAAGLDYIDGKFITMFQSASDQYWYGKFLFTNKIVGLEF